MKIGDYVRTKSGIITQIEDIWENERIFFKDMIDQEYFTSTTIYASSFDKYIYKSSPNIIDLIEAGDYVNGEKVVDKFDYLLAFEDGQDGNWYIRDDEIKSILTKEQFSNMEYEIER